MKRELSPAERIRRALNRTSFFPCMEERADILARLDRIAASPSTSLMEIAGVERSLKSHIEVRVFSADPIWSDVRALHAAWIVANNWSVTSLRESRAKR